jgi:hypothetical protein
MGKIVRALFANHVSNIVIKAVTKQMWYKKRMGLVYVKSADDTLLYL